MERLWHHRANDDSINSVTNQSELKTTTCNWCKAREKQVGVTITRTERDQCTGMTRSGTGLSRNDSIMTQTSVSLWCHSSLFKYHPVLLIPNRFTAFHSGVEITWYYRRSCFVIGLTNNENGLSCHGWLSTKYSQLGSSRLCPANAAASESKAILYL